MSKLDEMLTQPVDLALDAPDEAQLAKEATDFTSFMSWSAQAQRA